MQISTPSKAKKHASRDRKRRKSEATGHAASDAPLPIANQHRYAMSPEMMYRLGLQQTLTYGGAESTLCVLHAPVSRQSVYRCENLLRSTVLAKTQEWYRRMYGRLGAFAKSLHNAACRGGVLPEQNLISFECHRPRGDATNSSHCKSFKLFASDITSVFFIPALPYRGVAALAVESVDTEESEEVSECCRSFR